MGVLRIGLFAFVSTLICFASAKAALVFEIETVTNFDVLFYSTGPLATAANDAGIPLDTLIPAEARGVIQYTIDEITPGTTTANIQNAVSIGRLQGVIPGDFFSISPNVQFIGGVLDNIQQSGGVVTSADVVNLSMFWDMELVTGSGIAQLVSAAPLPFSGRVSGVPFRFGDQIAGPIPGPVDGLLDLGGGNLDPNPAIYVSNSSITAVPEPTFGTAVVVCIASLFFWRRKSGEVNVNVR